MQLCVGNLQNARFISISTMTRKAAAPKDAARLAAIVGAASKSSRLNAAASAAAARLDRVNCGRQVFMTKDQAGRVAANSAKLAECCIPRQDVCHEDFCELRLVAERAHHICFIDPHDDAIGHR
jgi:hypothetical protein